MALDPLRRTPKAEDMASHAAAEQPSRPVLTLGRLDRVRIQVGYRAQPDGPAYLQFLLDLPTGAADSAGFDEARALAALEPVLYAGAEAPRHYSLHQHRWHTSWGASPGTLDLGLLVTTGPRTPALAKAAHECVTAAFRGLLEIAGRPAPSPTTRDAAILRARDSVVAAYSEYSGALSLTAEEHHAARNSWTIGLSAPGGDKYDVVVGLVDGYAGSVRVRHSEPIEVSDSIGAG
jgi:hypothetical protein